MLNKVCYTDVLLAICQELVGCSELRVDGPAEGYRCKATYSLLPCLKVSPLAMPQVNNMCEVVAEFARERSTVAQQFPSFFFEICAKYTRAGEGLIKIVLMNQHLTEAERNRLTTLSTSAFVNERAQEEGGSGIAATTLFDFWMNQSSEPDALVSFLRARFPKLVAVVAHVRLLIADDSVGADKGGNTAQIAHTKPGKDCAYIPLTSDNADAVTEYTPNGIPFRLSADSFCEVNQPMEDAIFHTIVEFLQLKSQTPRKAFITGRDVNSVCKTFEQYYDHVVTATSCPRVALDAQVNGIEPCHLVSKDKLYEVLRRALHANLSTDERSSRFHIMHVLVTAGRHGLHPHTVSELVSLSRLKKLTDVIYVSCNVASLARDFHIMKEGFRVHHLRTFDFFPNTDYVMSVVHLKPLLDISTPHCNDLLLIPVGPPGVGKSTCGRQLKGFFEKQSFSALAMNEAHDATRKKVASAKGKACKSTVSPASVPRTFAKLPCTVSVHHLERDDLFHQLREGGASLKNARLSVHRMVCSALAVPCETLQLEEPPLHTPPSVPQSLPRKVLYMDSTNGSVEARQLYRDIWANARDTLSAGAPCAVESKEVEEGEGGSSWLEAPCVEAIFYPIPATDVLLERVQDRPSHPSFPVDSEARKRKIACILQGIDTDGSVSPQCVVHVDCDAVGEGGGERVTTLQMIVTTVAHLHFAHNLAKLSVRSGTIQRIMKLH